MFKICPAASYQKARVWKGDGKGGRSQSLCWRRFWHIGLCIRRIWTEERDACDLQRLVVSSCTVLVPHSDAVGSKPALSGSSIEWCHDRRGTLLFSVSGFLGESRGFDGPVHIVSNVHPHNLVLLTLWTVVPLMVSGFLHISGEVVVGQLHHRCCVVGGFYDVVGAGPGTAVVS